jgi:cytoskeletal protein CcmA (bactofilin family)
MGIFQKDEVSLDKTKPLSSTVADTPVYRQEPTKRKENPVSLKTDEMTTILGKGSEFEGKLQFEGTLRIEGVYSGEISSDSVLVVEEGAKVSAEIDIGTIIVNGLVNGNVRAKKGVEIRGAGRLNGNIDTPSLYIEKGVIFEGSCKMSKGKAPQPGVEKKALEPANEKIKK